MSRVIIAGPRDYFNKEKVYTAIKEAGFFITEVVSGGAEGVDRLGEEWSKEHNVRIKHFKADWSKYGKSAGPVRNAQMAEYADALIAVVPYFSKGTANMIKQATQMGLETFVYKC